MEVPRRLQPSAFTLPLHTSTSDLLEGVNPRRTDPQQEDEVEEEERHPKAEPQVPVIVEPPELEVTDTLTSVSVEDRRRSEEAAARERAAQRQQLAVEELVQSERNYLRLLQLTTVTIRSNLQKLQVRIQRGGRRSSSCLPL